MPFDDMTCFHWGNSCLVLDAQWCHNSMTQRYHIGGQVNNKEVLGVPGLTLVKVITTWSALNLPRLFSVLLYGTIRKSTPNGTNVTNQLFLEESLFCSIVTSEHLCQILVFNFLTSAVEEHLLWHCRKKCSAWKIVTPLTSELWRVTRLCFYTSEQ